MNNLVKNMVNCVVEVLLRPLKTIYDELTAQQATMSAMLLLVGQTQKNGHGCVASTKTAPTEDSSKTEGRMSQEEGMRQLSSLHSTVHHHKRYAVEVNEN